MVTSLSTFIVSRDTNYMQAFEVLSERIDDIPLLLHMLVSMGVPEHLDSAYTRQTGKV